MKSQPLSRFALAQARARFKRLCATFNRSAKRPEKPESAHELRVSLRRFLQCLEMFGGLFPSKPAEKLRKRSRKLLDLCGAKRDYDVALQVATDAGLPPHSSTVMKLRERQAEESHRLARRLRKRLASKKTPQRWKKQLHAAKRPGGDWKWSAGIVENAQQALPSMNRRFFEAGDHAAAARGDFETLHRFRLLTKNYRYGLELFHPALGWRFKTEIRALRQLQEHLGSINDCVTVLQLREIDRAAATAIRRLLVTRERRFRDFWRAISAPPKRARWTLLPEAPPPAQKPPPKPSLWRTSNPSHRPA